MTENLTSSYIGSLISMHGHSINHQSHNSDCTCVLSNLMHLSQQIYSGQFLCEKSVKTGVEVEVIGLPGDPKKKYRTKWSTTPNAINPVWNEEPFVFEKVETVRWLQRVKHAAQLSDWICVLFIDLASRNGFFKNCCSWREWEICGTQNNPHRCHPVRSVNSWGCS